MANVIEVVIRAVDQASSQIKAVGNSLNTFAGTFDSVKRGADNLSDLQKKFAALGAAGGPLASSANAAAAAIGKVTPAGIAAGVAVAGLGVAAVATAKALVDAAIEGGKFADDMGTLAERAGTTSEAFSKLAFAAGQFDASTESVSGALKFLSKNIFDARNGSQEAADAFIALGLSVDELARVDSSEAFLRVADALSRVETQSSQTALSLRVMGRGANELVPLFAAGRGVIEGYGDDLERVNGVVRSTSVAIADDFDNAQKKFDSAVKGMKVSLSDLLLPAFTDVVDEVNNAIASFVAFEKQIKSTADAVKNVTFDAPLASFKKFVLEVTNGLPIIGDLVKMMVALGSIAPLKVEFIGPKGSAPLSPTKRTALPQGPDFQDVVKGTDPTEILSQREADRKRDEEAKAAAADAQKKRDADAKKAIEDAKKAMEAFNKVVADSYLISQKLGQSLLATLGAEKAAPLVAALQQVKAEAITADTALRGLKPLDTPQDAIKKLIDNQPGEVQQLELIPPDQDQRLAAALQYLDDIGASVGSINETLSTMGETWATITLGFEAFGAALRDALDPARNLIADMSDAAYRFAETFTASFGDLFEDLVVKGHRFRDAFASFLAAIGKAVAAVVKDIAAAIAKALILRALTGGLFSGGGTVVQSIAGAAAGGSVRLAAGGSFAAPARMASGGRISILGGNPQAFDRIPALLSPGEAVLPTVGGRSPGPLLSSLESLGKDLAMLIARGSTFAAPQAATVNHFNLNAIDADGFRGYVRTGSFAREFSIAGDPARD